MKKKIQTSFLEKFGSDPLIFKSPGRINLIGEHTDYNDGFVLPAAIDKAIYFAVKPNKKGKYRLFAHDLSRSFETDAINLKPSNVHWANYLLGVIAQFQKAGKVVPGFDCVFGGDIPSGAGMSSSAAIECGLAKAINTMFGFGFNDLELVKFSQIAEHEYANVMCGIMDQFAIMFGKKSNVIKLDCRNLDYTYFPFEMDKHMFVLVNTGVKHSLASSAYNTRRKQCEDGVAILKKYDPAVKSLRDVSISLLEKYKDEFDPITYKRCKYVIQENNRLNFACDALEQGKLELFGQYMYGSHVGLKDMYEVSCKELDKLVEIARNSEGVLGARMMGGGFGGCTLNLVERKKVNSFTKIVLENYRTPNGDMPEIFEVSIEDGTKQIA